MLPVPGFTDRLNHEEVAQRATFVRSGWSNHVSAVKPSQVSKVRETLKP